MPDKFYQVRRGFRFMLHRFLSTLAMASICFCSSPAVPVAGTVVLTEPELKFDAAPLPSNDTFAEVARTDPLQMLRLAAKRYKISKPEAEKVVISGYTASFLKQERIGDTLHSQEVIRVWYRESPYAVLMLWEQGSRNMAEGTLFASGENNGKMLVWLPKLFGRITEVDPRSRLPRGSARYTIEEFGFFHSVKRALTVWTAAEARGALQCKFLGTRKVAEADDRECHIVQRTCAVDEIDPFAAGEVNPRITDANRADSFRTITLYFDTRTWLQLGAELHRSDGALVSSYFYRNVVLNPALAPETFSRGSLRK